MIGAAIAALGFASPAAAQKDAAEKAKEGSVDHWIEFYRTEQRKSTQEPLPPSVDRAVPAERPGSGAAPPDKNERK